MCISRKSGLYLCKKQIGTTVKRILALQKSGSFGAQRQDFRVRHERLQPQVLLARREGVAHRHQVDRRSGTVSVFAVG